MQNASARFTEPWPCRAYPLLAITRTCELSADFEKKEAGLPSRSLGGPWGPALLRRLCLRHSGRVTHAMVTTIFTLGVELSTIPKHEYLQTLLLVLCVLADGDSCEENWLDSETLTESKPKIIIYKSWQHDTGCFFHWASPLKVLRTEELIYVYLGRSMST